MPSEELARIAQKAARGGMFLLVGNASSTVILAVGSIIIARLLGPSNYGSYVLATVFPFLLVSFSDAGMAYALMRFPAKLRSRGDLDRANVMIRIAFLFRVCMGLVAFLICYGGANVIATSILNRAELAPLVRLASALIVLQAVYDAVVYSFVGLDLMQFSGGLKILQSSLKSILGPVLVLIGFGVVGALSGYLVSLAVAGIAGACLLFMKYARSAGWTRDSFRKELRVMLSYSLPLYVAAASSVFLIQYQNIVLAHFAGDLEIGNFNAASNFNMLLGILGAPISTAMFPMFSKLDPETQREELISAFKLSGKYVSLLLIPASVATMVLSRELVYLVYGRSYLLAPSYLIMISTFYLLNVLSYYVIGSFLGGVGETMTMLKMDIFQLAVFLPLGPALAWPWGVYGLVIAFVLANAVGTVYGLHAASVKFGLGLNLRANARILVAASAAAIPTILLLQLYPTGTGIVSFVIGGLVYLITYLTLTPLLGALSRSDVDNLKTVFHKMAPLATLANPILRYESWILSATGRD